LITGRWYLQLFKAFTRCLLAFGFIPPSIPKIRHRPFTVLPHSNPVGHYFNALYQTGFYYEFIGWSQIIAAMLLLLPRTAHIGSLMFLPTIVNIAVLTCSVGFKGTWQVTIFMSLADPYLGFSSFLAAPQAIFFVPSRDRRVLAGYLETEIVRYRSRNDRPLRLLCPRPRMVYSSATLFPHQAK
jgi:hypothetical protein